MFAGATLPLVFPSNLKFCTSQSSIFPVLVKATGSGASTLLKPYSSLLMQIRWDSGWANLSPAAVFTEL